MLTISHIEVCFAMGLNYNLVLRGMYHLALVLKAGNVVDFIIA